MGNELEAEEECNVMQEDGAREGTEGRQQRGAAPGVAEEDGGAPTEDSSQGQGLYCGRHGQEQTQPLGNLEAAMAAVRPRVQVLRFAHPSVADAMRLEVQVRGVAAFFLLCFLQSLNLSEQRPAATGNQAAYAKGAPL